MALSWLLGVSCCQPPAVENAKLSAENQLFGDIAFYTCETGFEVSDGVTDWNVTCQSDKTWSESFSCSSEKHYYSFRND